MRRIFYSLGAAALAGTAVSLVGGPVPASTAAAAGAEGGFGGYTASATAAPVTVELYEPTIPIPATPQLELALGYSVVESDSGSSLGRASWLWPGDPVGEGLKTFVEQMGLPPQLGENGYPVQVNASQPSGTATEADEPFPGMVMRTSAKEGATVAQVGFSPDAEVQDGVPAGEGEAEGPLGGLPLSLGSGLLTDFGQAITGGLTLAADDPADDPTEKPSDEEQPAPSGPPGLPPELAALVDVEGYASSSRTASDDAAVTSIARSALGEVRLLGGLITLEGVNSVSRSTTDGKQGATTDQARIGGVTVAGQTFALGPAGAEAAGQQTPLPALPPELTGALAQLGVTITLPPAVRTQDGDKATNAVAGLRVEIDAKALKRQLAALPVGQLVDAFPADPPELKGLLQAVTGLASKVVVTLGTASTEVDTVKGIALPPVDEPADGDEESGGTPTDGAGSGGGGGGGGAAPAGSVPSASGPAASGGNAPAATGDLPAAQLTGSGLPPLYSLPGALLVAGIALAAVGGSWLRRAGVIALGGAGACPHGLDSGLPDLRKAP